MKIAGYILRDTGKFYTKESDIPLDMPFINLYSQEESDAPFTPGSYSIVGYTAGEGTFYKTRSDAKTVPGDIGHGNPLVSLFQKTGEPPRVFSNVPPPRHPNDTLYMPGQRDLAAELDALRKQLSDLTDSLLPAETKRIYDAMEQLRRVEPDDGSVSLAARSICGTVRAMSRRERRYIILDLIAQAADNHDNDLIEEIGSMVIMTGF